MRDRCTKKTMLLTDLQALQHSSPARYPACISSLADIYVSFVVKELRARDVTGWRYTVMQQQTIRAHCF